MNQHPVRLVFRFRKLLFRIVKSEIKSRYAGSVIGVGWAILSPLFLMAIYAIVYSVVFQIRIPEMSVAEYILYIFSGLIPVLMTNEVLSAGVSSVVTNKDVLGNTVFPIELVPIKTVLIAQTTMLVGFFVILVSLVLVGNFSWTIVFLPIIWFLHLCALSGVLWIISLINLVFRDMQNIIGVIMLVLIFASPIAYTPTMIPQGLKLLIYLNPLAYFIMAYQYVVVLGELPPTLIIMGAVIISSVLTFLGGIFFMKAKKALIDYA